jgi:hypothetical protein
MPTRCSRCGSNSIRRSKRRGVIEKALSIIVRPSRCRDCDHRFFPLFQTSRSHAKASDSVDSRSVEGSGISAKAI